MNTHSWNIFSKNGSQIQWFPDSLINLKFESPLGLGATGFLITDPSGIVVDSKITNGGFYYNLDTSIYYNSVLDTTYDLINTSINFLDVSIFKPDLVNTLAIKSLSGISVNSISMMSYMGLLYKYNVLLDPRGICPYGWHIATPDDFNELAIFVDPSASTLLNNAGKLKSTSTDTWNPPNIGAMNLYGLNIQGTGYRGFVGDFEYFKEQCQIWNYSMGDLGGYKMVTEFNTLNDNMRTAGFGATVWMHENNGASIRFVKDDSNNPGTVRDYDGNYYNTVKIGNQVWMAENLMVRHYNNGDEIPYIEDIDAWRYGTVGAICSPNNDVNNVTTIGPIKIFASPVPPMYPSYTYAAALYIKPVSVGLIETETLLILEKELDKYIRPIDSKHPNLLFRFEGPEDEINFFVVDEDSHSITWTDSLYYVLDNYVENSPLSINIGFKSNYEGVFERILRIYHVIDNKLYTLAEIVVNAQAIGEDERFRSLINNFGLPDPMNIQHLFKEADIKEANPDFELLNSKSKHMILEHDKIMPYIGTYKALINAIKWLGYDDIYVREWFKDVKANKKLSLVVPFDAKDRSQTIMKFSIEERKFLKKLNQLSLVYCLTSETGELDDYGVPITKNCYSYILSEVQVKLYALKNWLEENIIGVNSRIVDLTGEGVYYERFKNMIYNTDSVGFEAKYEQSITPTTINNNSELVYGDSSIYLTLTEFSKTKLSDLTFRFKDLVNYCWNPNIPNGPIFSADNQVALTDISTLLVGPTLGCPTTLSDIMWRLSVKKKDGGMLNTDFVSNPLFIYENEIKFHNVLDISSEFSNSNDIVISLEKAYLRDPNIDLWEDSIAYSVYDSSYYGQFVMESSLGIITKFNGPVSFYASDISNLTYAYDTNYKVPLLSFYDYSFTDANSINTVFPQIYYLDILNGKIIMDASVGQTFINFENIVSDTVDTQNNIVISSTEQIITLNAIYESDRMPLQIPDPSIYYTFGQDASGAFPIDNTVFDMKVNHIGDYSVEVFGWDGFNNIFYNIDDNTYNVWIKNPTIYTLKDGSTNCNGLTIDGTEINTLINNNIKPIYDKDIMLQGLTLEYDSSLAPYLKIPSITYFQDLMEPNTINKFYNLTERVLSRSSSTLIIDSDFESFNTGDVVNIVMFDKGMNTFISETSTNITFSSGNGIITIDALDAGYVVNNLYDLYIQNDTQRTVTSIINNTDYFSCSIAGYTFIPEQLVTFPIYDLTGGFVWSAAYRVRTSSGSSHTFDGQFPNPIKFGNPANYSVKAKHAFSGFSTFNILTDHASEINQNFHLYLKDTYLHQYYIDNTFVVVNVLFDQNKVNNEWSDTTYDTYCMNYVPIEVSSGTPIILKAIYDPSIYMIEQHNIWTVKYNETKSYLFKVYNDIVTYKFTDLGYYDVICETYDKFGNISKIEYDGLIKIV